MTTFPDSSDHVVNMATMPQAPVVVDDRFTYALSARSHLTVPAAIARDEGPAPSLTVDLRRGALRVLQAGRAVHVSHELTTMIRVHFQHEKMVHALGIRNQI